MELDFHGITGLGIDVFAFGTLLLAQSFFQDRVAAFTTTLVRDYVQRERAVMELYPTDEQIADMWTKQLGQGLFVAYRGCFMGLVPFLRS